MRFIAIKRSFQANGVAGALMFAFSCLALQSFTKPVHSMPISGVFFQQAYQNFVIDKRISLIPVAVFGKDQRKRLPRRYKKLDHQIGLLHNPRTNTLCTAFCVGPDMIATASHCLYSHRKRNRLYLSSILFKLKTGNKNARIYSKLAGHRTRQTRRYIVTGTSKMSRKPPIGAARDWAVARLERPVCNKGWFNSIDLDHLKLEDAARNKKLFQVAYHMDYKNWQIAYSRSCSINRNFGGLTWSNIKKHFALPNSLILHRCDTGEASSGSPLLMDTEQGPVVIGINVGTYQQRQLTVKNGRVIGHTKYKTIANTAVSAKAFSRKITILKKANVITNKSDLKLLQSDLRQQRFYKGRIDGIYGSRTELAIKAFERGSNRPETGLPTSAILLELDKSRTEPVSIETSAGYKPQKKTSNQAK
ncbi:MAG: trypsin-like serine protease [bacterium]|nr:trypsin-like serine protease [bacterium]